MKKIFLVIAVTCLLETSLNAQQHQPDPFGDSLFPPELIMQNQQAIKLSESQRKAIVEEIQKAQSEFMSMQWDLQKEMESLKSLINRAMVDENSVVVQLEKLLEAENKIKRRQITLLVRIKNALTAEQQSKLQGLKPGGR